jgi:hypothetical protein
MFLAPQAALPRGYAIALYSAPRFRQLPPPCLLTAAQIRFDAPAHALAGCATPQLMRQAPPPAAAN